MVDTVKHNGNKNVTNRTRMGKWDKKAVGLPFFSIGFVPYGAWVHIGLSAAQRHSRA